MYEVHGVLTLESKIALCGVKPIAKQAVSTEYQQSQVGCIECKKILALWIQG